MDFTHDAPEEITLIKPRAGASIESFLAQLRKVFVPKRIAIVATHCAHQQRLVRCFSLLHKKPPLNGKVTAYVCQRRVCELPTTDPNIFAKQLHKVTLLSPTSRK